MLSRLLLVSASAFFISACSGANQGSGVTHRSGVAAALVSEAKLGDAQVSTFQADVRSGWAVAYDPAVPAGCSPGGISEPTGERPCQAYVLQRLKTTWKLRAVGPPGKIDMPQGAPKDLGATEKLTYLGR